MDSSERGMNPVTMTIINPQKEYCQSQGSNQQLPVIKSCMLQTELWGLALVDWEECSKYWGKKIPGTFGMVNWPSFFDYNDVESGLITLPHNPEL